MSNVIFIKQWQFDKLQKEIDTNVMLVVDALLASAAKLREELLYVTDVDRALKIIREQHKLVMDACTQAQGNGIDIAFHPNGRYTLGRWSRTQQ